MKKFSLLLIVAGLLSFMNINSYAYELSLPDWSMSYANIDSSICEVQVDKETVHSGLGSLYINYMDGWVSNHYLQAFPSGNSVEVGEEYVISFWLKSEGSQTTRLMWNWESIWSFSGTFDWTYYEIEYVPTINDMKINFIVDQKAQFWVDDMKICAKGDSKNLLRNGDMENGDFTPCGEVKEVTVSEHDSALNISWKAPSDEDYYEVALYEISPETNVQTFVAKSGQSVYELTVDGLTNGKLYAYLIKTVDKYGNMSNGKYIFGTPVIEDVYARNVKESYDDNAKILTVKADIINNTYENGLTAELIAAVYDTENKLIGLEGYPVEIPASGTENCEISLKGIEGKYTLELYLWDNAENFCPLMDIIKKSYIDYYVPPTPEFVKVKSKSGSEQLITDNAVSDVEDVESIEIIFDLPVNPADDRISLTDEEGNVVDFNLSWDNNKCTLLVNDWLFPGSEYVLTVGTGIESTFGIEVENEVSYTFRVVSGEINAEITNISPENFVMSPGCFEKLEADTVYDVHITYDNFTGKSYDVPVVFEEYDGKKLLSREFGTFRCEINNIGGEGGVKYTVSNPDADSVTMYVADNTQSLLPVSEEVVFDNLNPVTDNDIMVIELLNEDMVDFVTNHAGENVEDYNTDTLDVFAPKPAEFRWSYTPGAESYTLTISENSDMTDAVSYTTEEQGMQVEDLFMGTEYYYQVEAFTGSESVISPVYKFETAYLPRTIYIEDVSNTRDMGGYYVNGGEQRIRQGMIYRGGAFDDGPITSAGIDKVLNTYKIKTELDFRGMNEGISSSLFPSDTEIHDNFYKYPIFYFDTMKLENLTGENEVFKEGLLNSMKLFANPDNYPIYVHCKVGRDRTGTFAIILGTLLGMERDEILTDFELTEFSRYGDWVDYTGAKSIYNYLRDYGNGTPSENAGKYLRDIGVTQDEIDTIKEILLVDAE